MSKKTLLVLLLAGVLLGLVLPVGKYAENAQSTGVPSMETALEAPGVSGLVEIPVRGGTTVSHPSREGVKRYFVDVALPTGLDVVQLDAAELVLTVSSYYDPTEPLLVAAAPAVESDASSQLAAAENWNDADDQLDPEYLTVAPVNSGEPAEVRIDVTHIVERWLSGDLNNYGLVLKSIGENRSTFQWIRDGRYEGGDAKLVLLYSKI